jgi:ubiquitin carboxyl-terminal hydrolase 16/45
MSMEEKDLIKLLQPPSSTTSGHLRPGHGQPKRTRQRIVHHPHSNTSMGAGSLTHTPEGEEKVDGVLVKDRMIPFADALFGGSLVSVVICQGCKSVSPRRGGSCGICFQDGAVDQIVSGMALQVSHTYEGFMDISLSIGKEQPKVRKVSR